MLVAVAMPEKVNLLTSGDGDNMISLMLVFSILPIVGAPSEPPVEDCTVQRMGNLYHRDRSGRTLDVHHCRSSAVPRFTKIVA